MTESVMLNTVLMAQADPVAYGKANMNGLRATYNISKAMVSQAAATIARMQYYSASVVGTFGQPQMTIGKSFGNRVGKGSNPATFGFSGDLMIGTSLDCTYETKAAGVQVATGASPLVLSKKMTSQAANNAFSALLAAAVTNLDVLPNGAQGKGIPILAADTVELTAVVVTAGTADAVILNNGATTVVPAVVQFFGTIPAGTIVSINYTTDAPDTLTNVPHTFVGATAAAAAATAYAAVVDAETNLTAVANGVTVEIVASVGATVATISDVKMDIP